MWYTKGVTMSGLDAGMIMLTGIFLMAFVVSTGLLIRGIQLGREYGRDVTWYTLFAITLILAGMSGLLAAEALVSTFT